MDKTTAIMSMEECFRTLNLAVDAFQNFLSAKTSSDTSSYYQAQDYLAEGRTRYKESLDEISEILGSVPEDASPAFKEWKVSFIEKIGILSQSTEFEALRSELQNEEILLNVLTIEEIDILLVKHFSSQKTGKRKLANIKTRMLFDKMRSLMDEAESLSVQSKERLYQQR